MNIAIVTYSIFSGGIEMVLFSLSKYFQRNGFDITVVETLKEGEWKKYFEENSIPVKTFAINRSSSKKVHSKRILDYLKKFDVVFLNDSPYAQAIIGCLPSKTLVFPILHSVMESMQINACCNNQYWTKLISVSPIVQNQLLEKYPLLDKGKLLIIPNGIKITSNPSSKEFNKNKEGYSFLYAGRLSHFEKGILLIPEIIDLLKDKIPIAYADIYGDGPSKEDLEKKIRKMELDLIIKCHGAIPHEQVLKELESHDFLLMPSFFEGHPIVLMEAMVCMTIPFVSNLPGCTDVVVKDGYNGFLCESGNAEDFANKITQIIKHGNLMEIAENARKTIIENFSDESMGNKYIELINNEITKRTQIKRDGRINLEILGDFPSLPVFLIRPVRKILKILRLYKRN